MIDAILLDLDNTLLDFNRAERTALDGALRQLGLAPDETMLRRYSQINLALWKQLEQGEITRPAVKLRRFVLLFAEYAVDAPPAQAAALYEERLAVGHWFVEGAPALLEALAPRYRLYLVTNGTARVQQGRLQSAGITRYFRDVFISERIGFDKPHPGFFTHCFAHIPDFRRETTVIAGDSLSSDIQGGKNAGIRTAWFNPTHAPLPAAPVPDRSFDRLADLPALLAQWDPA